MKLFAAIVAPYPGGAALRERHGAALALVGDDSKLPPQVQTALEDFLKEPDEPRLRSIQLAVARSSLWTIGVGELVALVTDVANSGHLAMAEAAAALAAIPYAERKRMSPAVQHLIEVADAVQHDVEDGVMAVEDDDVFAKALRAASVRGDTGQR